MPITAGTITLADEIKTELVVFAATNEQMAEHVDLIEGAGLRPMAIEPVSCVLFRNFNRLYRRDNDKNSSVVFIDIGSKYTTVVFGKNDEIRFVKHIPIGGADITNEVAKKLNIQNDEALSLRESIQLQEHCNQQNGADDHEKILSLDNATKQMVLSAAGTVVNELAQEIALCFRYYMVTFRGNRVKNAFFSGGEANSALLLNTLKRELTVDVEVVDPFKGLDMTKMWFNDDRRGKLCQWSVAVGLGLRGIVG